MRPEKFELLDDDFFNNYIVKEVDNVDGDAWLIDFDRHQKLLDELGW